jgi:HK97 family phage portal protein
MSIRSFFGFAEKPDAQFDVFGIDNLPPEMREGMTAGGMLAPRISRAEALQVPAVLRSRNLIAGTLARLPVHLRNKDRRIVTGTEAPTTLFDQINPDVPDVVTYAATYEDLLFEGISWWRVLDRNFQGWPTFAEHIDWKRVHVSPTEGRVYVDGYPVTDDGIIRFDSPNPPLLVHAARAIRTCLTLDQTANGYANEPIPMGYFTPREGMRPNEDDDKIQGILDKWAIARAHRVWGYVPASLDLKQLQFNAEQIQLADQRQHAVLEIARAAGVDPEDLGVSTTSRTYQNAEQRRLDLLDFTLAHYMAALEERLSMHDVVPRSYRAKVNLDGFLRADTKTRMETYKIGREVGAYSDDRIAELEDIPTARQPQPVSPPTLVPVPNEEVG